MTNLTHLDLFSGIGGFALAARWCGVATVQFVEIDARCRAFLAKAHPGVPIHDDIKTLVSLCEEFVHTVGNERFLRVTPDVNRATRLMLESGATQTELNEEKMTENTIEEEREKLLTTTEENAPVVGNVSWNFFASIINSITAIRSGNSSILHQCGKLRLNEGFQTIIRCFATTATTQNNSTAYVRIKKPWLLTAGVPCQPASRAGKQRGKEDDRWLWDSALAMLHYARPA